MMVIGRAPEGLTLAEQIALAGKVVAVEVYNPQKLPLRRIEALGDSAEECMAQLAERGLDAKRFEFVVLKAPW